MLKAIVNYSKKVPADTEYSSQGYSLSLETEITAGDPASIQAQLHEAFGLVKASVDQELANAGTSTGNDVTNVTHVTGNRSDAPARATGDRPYGKRDEQQPERKASNKQISYINSLVSNRGIPLSELMADIRSRFHVESLYDLTAKQASSVIDEMNKVPRTQRAA